MVFLFPFPSDTITAKLELTTFECTLRRTGTSPGYPTVAGKEGDMVRLDDKLLLDACEISNGANVPYLKKMISAYEDAVNLHNRNCPRHEVYHRQSELRLRQYVRNCKEADIRIKTFDAIDLASKATIKSIELTHEYKRLEKQLAEWESRTDFSR